MSSELACPECGRPLPEGALDEVCPVCSLENALSAHSFGPATEIDSRVQRAPELAQPDIHDSAREFGDYELLELIARGGVGMVYKARQKSLDRIVALKMMLFGPHASPEFVQRFRIEACAAASLSLPNIVAVHEVGVHEGQHFFVMDFVAGPSLAEVIANPKSQVTDFRRAARWLKTIAEAVHYAHERGILHRDLKPSNVVIDEHDEPHITDFGLAKRLHDSQFSNSNPQLTLTGQILGSPNYIPPEQASGKRGKVSRQSDVYALGAMMYHLLTGGPPFQSETIRETLQQVLHAEPIAPRLLRPNAPRDLETICLKCLEKDPARRYPTAEKLAEDIGRFLSGQPILARPVGPAVKTWKWCRARPALAGLSAALAFSVVAGLSALLWQLNRTQTSELLAQRNAYAADMSLAQVALEKDDLGAAMALLNAQRPGPSSRDFCGWEWRYLWMRCRSDELFELTRSTNAVERVALSSEGRLAVGHNDRATLSIWDINSRQRLFSLETHGNDAPVACSPQRNLLAHPSTETGTVSVVSLDNRHEIARLRHLTNVVNVAFSRDGNRLFTMTKDGAFAEWDVASGEVVHTAKLSPDILRVITKHIAFSPHGVFAFSTKNGFGLWELLSSGKTNVRLTGTVLNPTFLRFSPDGTLLAAGIGESDSEIHVWATDDLWRSADLTPPPRVRLGPHRDWICDVAFSPDNRAMVSASADSVLRVWHLDEPENCRRYKGHKHQVLSVAWSPDGQRIVSSGKDGSVRVWDPSREPAFSGPRVLPVSARFFCFDLSSDGKRAVTLDPTNRTVLVWDTVHLRLAETLAFAGINNNAVAWSPDGTKMATGDELGNLRLWDLVNRRELTNAVIPGYLVGHFHFTHDGRFLAVGGLRGDRDRMGKLWRIDDWREIPLPQGAMENFLFGDFAPKSGLFVALHWGGALDVWDVATGQCRARFSQPFAGPNEHGMAWFSPNGRTWASFTQKGVLCLWDRAEQRPPVIIPRSTQELWHLAFSADGSRMLRICGEVQGTGDAPMNLKTAGKTGP